MLFIVLIDVRKIRLCNLLAVISTHQLQTAIAAASCLADARNNSSSLDNRVREIQVS